LRRVLHRAFDFIADSWDAERKTGGRALCAIDGRQPLQNL
jgi:hypothetical protein